MKDYMSVRSFCKETGFPVRAMDKLVHSHHKAKFTFRTSGKANAQIMIKTDAFKQMLDRGDFKEEGIG